MSIIIHGITKEEFARRMWGEGIEKVNPDIIGSCDSFYGYKVAQLPTYGRLIDADALERVAEDMQKKAEYFDERARQLVCDSGEVSQYSWAVSLRETYRRFVKTLDEISTSAIIEEEER